MSISRRKVQLGLSLLLLLGALAPSQIECSLQGALEQEEENVGIDVEDEGLLVSRQWKVEEQTDGDFDGDGRWLLTRKQTKTTKATKQNARLDSNDNIFVQEKTVTRKNAKSSKTTSIKSSTSRTSSSTKAPTIRSSKSTPSVKSSKSADVKSSKQSSITSADDASNNRKNSKNNARKQAKKETTRTNSKSQKRRFLVSAEDNQLLMGLS